MNELRKKKIKEYRLSQPVEELRRKQEKAQRKNFWTVEDIDLAEVEANIIIEKLRWLEKA